MGIYHEIENHEIGNFSSETHKVIKHILCYAPKEEILHHGPKEDTLYCGPKEDLASYEDNLHYSTQRRESLPWPHRRDSLLWPPQKRPSQRRDSLLWRHVEVILNRVS